VGLLLNRQKLNWSGFTHQKAKLNWSGIIHQETNIKLEWDYSPRDKH